MLVDSHGRAHRTLRISVTDRCQMRCTYCLPHGAPPPRPREEILTFEEIATVARVGASLGLARLRLTGGEPLLRRDLPRLAGMLRRLPGVEELSLTTNGLLLGENLAALHEAGLDAISLSIDTLDAADFRAETGVDALTEILALLPRLAESGIRTEINAVLDGAHRERIAPLLRLARETGIGVRFIEKMPFEGMEWSEATFLPGAEVERVAREIAPFREVARLRPAAPARRFDFEDGGTFGLIEPVTKPFCSACDRLRMRSDGALFNCLFDRAGGATREILRAGARSGASRSGVNVDEAIADLFRRVVAAKGRGGMLDFDETRAQRARVMAEIGG